jgi:hypothetical protein
VQSIEAMRYKPEGNGFDSRWCLWNFSFNFSLREVQWPYLLNRINHDLVLLIVSLSENDVKLHFIKMEHHNVLRFLFVRGLKKIFLVGGMGVEDQQNGLSEVALSIYVIKKNVKFSYPSQAWTWKTSK